MQKRKLGNTCLDIAPLIFGGNVFGWTVDEVSMKYNTGPVQVALAWLLANPTITAPIASARNLDQLQAVLAGVSLKLQNSEIALLNEASA